MIDKMKVYQDTELSSKAVSVYLYLCERASKETKSCYPSMKTIAERSASFFGISEAFHSRIGKKCIHQKRKSVS